MVAAGMAKERSKVETGKGHTPRRTVNEISFHSLRRTATSLMKNAGVPAAVAMDTGYVFLRYLCCSLNSVWLANIVRAHEQ